MEVNESHEDNAERLARLERYLADGYLLHGSKKRIEILEPRQSRDDDPTRIAGNSNAVYAEGVDVRIPILKALFEKDDPTLNGWRSGYSTQGPGTPILVVGENYRFGSGFVHVLPRDTFEIEGDERDQEYVSRAPVAPIDVIEVDPGILELLDGVTRDGGDPTASRP
jgi:hypothetical protein